MIRAKYSNNLVLSILIRKALLMKIT